MTPRKTKAKQAPVRPTMGVKLRPPYHCDLNYYKSKKTHPINVELTYR